MIYSWTHSESRRKSTNVHECDPIPNFLSSESTAGGFLCWHVFPLCSPPVPHLGSNFLCKFNLKFPAGSHGLFRAFFARCIFTSQWTRHRMGAGWGWGQEEWEKGGSQWYLSPSAGFHTGLTCPGQPRGHRWTLLASIVGGKQGEEGWECKCWAGHEEASATNEEIFYQVFNVWTIYYLSFFPKWKYFYYFLPILKVRKLVVKFQTIWVKWVSWNLIPPEISLWIIWSIAHSRLLIYA